MTSDGQQSRALTLAGARMIALFMYVGTIPALAIVGLSVGPAVSAVPDTIAPWVLLVMAVAGYWASLSFEGCLLAEQGLRKAAQRRRSGNPEGVAAVVAVVTAAFGINFAVWGLVLHLLSFGTWPWYFYGLAALHGIHLQLRWDRYEDAVRKASR